MAYLKIRISSFFFRKDLRTLNIDCNPLVVQVNITELWHFIITITQMHCHDLKEHVYQNLKFFI